MLNDIIILLSLICIFCVNVKYFFVIVGLMVLFDMLGGKKINFKSGCWISVLCKE